MRTIIFTRGIPGSGKSYRAKQWVNESPDHRIRINYDDIRNMLGPYWLPSREYLVTRIAIEALREAMRLNYDIIIDNMNLSERSKALFIKEIYERNSYSDDKYTIEYWDFKTPLQECIDRDAKRDNPIGEKVIKEIYERNKNFYNHD